MTTDKMAKRSTGVHRRSGSNVWQWKIKAPKDLRHLYPSEWAHRCSLGTPVLQDANRKATELNAEWHARFHEQRIALNPLRIEKVTPEMGRMIAQRTLHDTLNREDVRIDQSWRKDLLRYHRGVGIVGMQSVAQDMGIAFTEDTPGAGEALRHYLQHLEEPLSAKLVEQPPAPTPKAIADAKPRTLRDVFDRWKAAKRQDTIDKTERVLEMFEQQFGNPPLTTIKRDQGDAFRAWLLQQDGASKTKHDRLTALKSLFNYARSDLEWLDRNPWERLDIEYKTENKRRPWTAAQVQAFFSLPLFTRYDLPTNQWRAGRDAAYWIPLLGLFTGARISELCQLRAVDVVTRDDQTFICINDEGEGSTVKTAAGVRDIPLHSELVRLGFLEYVEATKQVGHDRLWPDLKLRKDKPGGYFSAWFGEARKLVDEGVPDFHSLRHTVRTKMTEAGIADAVQDKITGHDGPGSVGTKVYSHPVAILRTAVEAIKYPGLALGKVYGQPAGKY
ncbi:tyrosine-type recombinase/integrase [Cupriavidus sp. D39]|uniref:tyrosine-type recombinase/integrase n=1 Tax=Cupriavidus sp. D39 TaxID=2997877 RepID=UPI00227028E2|nr:tyrosine-type recombinase/integrase [Cupriavidus sp. D39]MCY0855740.1 tyrosine-type recombinase/integrase [Cupriavidus sp. D39]